MYKCIYTSAYRERSSEYEAHGQALRRRIQKCGNALVSALTIGRRSTKATFRRSLERQRRDPLAPPHRDCLQVFRLDEPVDLPAADPQIASRLLNRRWSDFVPTFGTSAAVVLDRLGALRSDHHCVSVPSTKPLDRHCAQALRRVVTCSDLTHRAIERRRVDHSFRSCKETGCRIRTPGRSTKNRRSNEVT